ncbi:MAG TPA: NAD(P)/FAD-dependent oxidoreductase [Chitinophagaceae bacterium]|nr:NAD(P)/FAD-dependent oxidoreductase [Chitinophagaceae bacterium]HPH31491.1 NAD(P)/FAD-dependent oxidoreductase [Chitinophagaceae bacterium]HPN58125.1 NAD(P)/FAD-dependent oxidoreductase [Chitinophagaceae bacterium]
MAKKLVVIGGGAAGIFCAVNAARMNPVLDVILLEKSSKFLSKVRISGGGRCNLTHACFDREEMSRHYPRGQRFVKKAFHRFFTTDTIQWFEERGVPLKTEADGRMFPQSDNSESIVSCLLKEVNQYKVDIRMNAEVLQLQEKENGFALLLSQAKTLEADYVCVACGGYPKTSMFDWLLQTGHTIEPPVPSLFTFNIPHHPVTGLMGVSVPAATVKISGTKMEETAPLLITHWGLSGPAVLKLSARGARELAERNYHFSVIVNWLPGQQDQQLAIQFRSIRTELAAQKISLRNPFGLPQRLWDLLLELSGIDKEKRWADLPAKEQNKLVANIVHCSFDVKGKTTFKEEFVTAGGISLSGIDVNTMQSKTVPGLYFAGEIMDVDGVTGGFNFQHAWTSGFIAASAVAGRE